MKNKVMRSEIATAADAATYYKLTLTDADQPDKCSHESTKRKLASVECPSRMFWDALVLVEPGIGDKSPSVIIN